MHEKLTLCQQLSAARYNLAGGLPYATETQLYAMSTKVELPSPSYRLFARAGKASGPTASSVAVDVESLRPMLA